MSQPVTPPPLVAQEAATSVKWGGAAIVLSFVLLISVVAGPGTALLALAACFGTMMFCIGLEAEEASELVE